MRPWSEAVGYWLTDYYALATAVMIAAAAALRILGQPARRLSVAGAAVCGLAALALLVALPGWPRAGWPGLRVAPRADRRAAPGPVAARLVRAESAPAIGTEPPAVVPLGAASGPAMPEPGRGVVGRDEARTPLPHARLGAGSQADHPATRWPALGDWLFFAGGALVLGWLAIGSLQTAAVRRRARPAPDWAAELLVRVIGAGRVPPHLLLSGRLAQPVAVGLLRPTIILPDRFVEENPERRLEAVLAHEWAHIHNGDLWLIALARLLMPVLFAHPGYWWLRRRIRDDQELLADAAASAVAGGRVDYAEALLSWAAGAPARRAVAVAGSPALWERSSQLKRRIVVLLDRDVRVEARCPGRWTLGVRGGTALAVLALSVLTFRPPAVEAGPPAARAATKLDSGSAAETGTEPGAGEALRVIDDAGKPAPGANVYRSNSEFRSLVHEPTSAKLLGRTAPDGAFHPAPEEVQAALDRKAQLVVTAEGFGPGFADPSVGDGLKTIRLARDDVPIRGRLLDIEGRPVAGATVQVLGILWHPSGTLDEWIAALEAEKVAFPVQYRLLRMWANDDVPSLYPAAATDRDGRFTLRGVGRERIAALLISGPGIETRFEYVATREMPTVKVPDFDRQNRGRDVAYHGATFDLVLGPGLEVVGTVRDKDTDQPLAGATVQTTAAFGNPLRFLRATADAEGRYRLPGIPPKSSFGDAQDVLASVKDGRPYLPSVQPVGDGRGPGPITRDFRLKRGVWARGRVTDGSTGKPVRANFDYFILEENPHLKDYPRYGTVRVGMPFHADADGRYAIVVIPGRGILGARFGNDTYRLGVGIEKIAGLKPDQAGFIRARPSYLIPRNYNTLVELNPKEGDESITADITLDRGRTLKGTLIGPDGAPVSGALMMGAQDFFQSWSHQPLPSAEFEVQALGPESKRGLLFYHEGKQLAGAYVVKPGEEGPVTVRLEPCGSLTGRLVDAGGLPQAGVQITCDRPFGDEDESRFEKGSLPAPIKTDKDGHFRASGLVPGLKYSLRVWKGRMIAGLAAKDVVTGTGEVKDLGDVKVGE